MSTQGNIYPEYISSWPKAIDLLAKGYVVNIGCGHLDRPDNVGVEKWMEELGEWWRREQRTPIPEMIHEFPATSGPPNDFYEGYSGTIQVSLRPLSNKQAINMLRR